MRDMGGVKKFMPITFWCMALASCSLAGVPLIFSGFWSKDMILEASLVSGEYLLFVFGLMTVAVTAFYSFRMVGLVFYGEGKKESENVESYEHHLHESPPVMWVPCAILVGGTILLGVIGYLAREWLISTFGYLVLMLHGEVAVGTTTEYIVAFLSAISLAIGFIPAYFFYIKRSKSYTNYTQKGIMSGIWNFLFKRWYINRIFYHMIVYPTISLSKWLFSNLEVKVIDGFNYYLGRFTIFFSNWMFNNLEFKVVDGLNYRIADLVKRTSLYLRKWQTGSLNDYLIMVLTGLFIAVLILKYVIFGG
jgi:NADH-quinone oxidoreductase subunit L